MLREAPAQKEIEDFDETDQGTGVEASAPGIPMSLLLKRPLLWQMFSIFCLLSFSLYGVLSHLVPMLSDRGMPSVNAALVMSTLGISIVAARVIIGFIMDRYFAPFVAAICFLVSAIGVSLLATGAIDSLAFVAAIFIGFSMGAEMDMLAFLTSRYFGVENFGQVYGILFTSFLIGTSAGPVAYGLVFESTGSYILVLILSIVLMLASAIITARLPRYS